MSLRTPTAFLRSSLPGLRWPVRQGILAGRNVQRWRHPQRICAAQQLPCSKREEKAGLARSL
jgi:hypothetical protein